MQTQPLISLINNAQKKEAEAILRACVHCGFCNATCPTYQLLGDECDSPRGRIYLIKQMLEGATATGKTQQHLDRCLTCLACETTCPSNVAYSRLLDIGREVIEQRVQRSLSESVKRWMICTLLPYPQRFAVLLRLARFLTPVMPMNLQRTIPIIRSDVKFIKRQQTHVRRVLLLNGCVQSILAPAINSAATRVLDKLGISVMSAPSAGCCGALSYHLSNQKDGLDFMRRNIDAWLPYLDQGIEAIVITASGCGLMVKEYGKLLKHDTIYSAKAERIAALTKDIAEILTDEDLSSLKPAITGTVAFQSPCTLQHGQKLNGVVETLLGRLGLQLTPVADSHVCCGSAGTYSLMQPELSERLLKNKVYALEHGQPDIIVTANIGCLNHIQSMTDIPVRHWIEILDQAV
jgi:glycolate oxidase iron-sulfur subunit